MARNQELLQEASSALQGGKDIVRDRGASLLELQQQFKKLATSYAGLKGTLSERDAAIKQLQSQLDGISQELRSSNEEKESALLEIEKIRAQQRHLEKTGQKQGEDYAVAINRIAELSTLIASLEERNALLSEKVEEFLEKERLAKEENSRLQVLIDELTEENSKLLAELSSVNEEKDGFSSELDKLRRDLLSSQQEYSSINESYKALQGKYESLSEENLVLKAEISRRDVQYKSLQEKYSALEASNERNIAAISGLQQELDLVKSQKAQLERQKESLGQEILKIQRDRDEKLLLLEESQLKINELSAVIREKDQEIEVIKGKITEAELAIQRLHEDYAKRSSQSEAANETLEAEIALKESELAALKASESSKAREIEKFKHTQSELELSLSRLQSDIQQKEERIVVLTQASRSSEKDLGALRVSHESLLQQYEGLQSQLARKEKDIAVQQSSFDQYRAEAERAREENLAVIANLEKQYASQQQANKVLEGRLEEESVRVSEVQQTLASVQKEKKALKSKTDEEILTLSRQNSELSTTLRTVLEDYKKLQELYRIDFGQFKDDVARITADLNQSGLPADYDPEFNPDELLGFIGDEVEVGGLTTPKKGVSLAFTPSRGTITPGANSSVLRRVQPSPSRLFRGALGEEPEVSGRSSLGEDRRGLDMTLADEFAEAGEQSFTQSFSATSTPFQAKSLRFEPAPVLRLSSVAESVEESRTGALRRSLPVPGLKKVTLATQKADGEFSSELAGVNTPVRAVGELPPIRSRHSSPSLVTASDSLRRPDSRGASSSPSVDRVPTPPLGERPRSAASIRRSSLSSSANSSLDATRLDGRSPRGGSEHGSA